MNLALRTLALLPLSIGLLPSQEGAPKLPPGVALGRPTIVLAGGVATLEVPPGMRFLDAAATAPIREGAWGNPPDPTVQGMVVRGGFDPKADGRWAVTVHWQPIGHVSEDQWSALDPASLLEACRIQTATQNLGRAARHEPLIEVLDIPVPPRVDTRRHTSDWAKRYRIGDDELIAYEARAFGREGVFLMKATGRPDQLAELAAGSELVLSRLAFAPGHRYEDFAAGDKTGTLDTAGAIALGVWEQLSTTHKVLLGALALTGLLAVLRLVLRLLGR